MVKRRANNAEESQKKLVTFQHPRMSRGLVADMAELEGKSESEVIEDAVLSKIVGENGSVRWHVAFIYDVDMRRCFMALFGNLSAGINWKSTHTNGREFVELAREFSSYSGSQEPDENDPANIQYHELKSTVESTLNIIDRQKEDLSPEEIDGLEHFRALVEQLPYFVPYNFYTVVLNFWDVLCEWSFPHRFLRALAEMTEFHDTAENRMKLVNAICRICPTWDDSADDDN